jgi:hypothetical protein
VILSALCFLFVALLTHVVAWLLLMVSVKVLVKLHDMQEPNSERLLVFIEEYYTVYLYVMYTVGAGLGGVLARDAYGYVPDRISTDTERHALY